MAAAAAALSLREAASSKLHGARKSKVERRIGNSVAEDHHHSAEVRALAGAYQCAALDEPVFLHPESVLFPRDRQPPFVVYHALLRTSKSFMKGCTAIQPDWLYRVGRRLCVESAPLEQPPPRFDADEDCVMCWIEVYFGRHRWKLPLQQIPLPDSASHQRERHFARLLLEGAVVPALSEFR